VSLERTNIRSLDRQRAAALLAPDPAPTLVTADLSFTSLEPLLDPLLELAGPTGDVLALCKPQFEVGREIAARGRGVIRERADRRQALEGVVGATASSGAAIMGVVSSPILGPAGNAEFLVHIRRDASMDSATVATMLDAALDVAESLS
jgi:23S rRNA (cytidine1920-2'-O)/16S rRNA (cytidine1409-2'-O)-methyltransferase